MINTYGDAPDYEFGCEYGFLDLGGMELDSDDEPTAWRASGVRRRGSCCTEIVVGGLSFDVSLRQLDYLRLTDAGLSLKAAAERAGLSDLIACAELSAWAEPGCDAPTLLARTATERLTEIRAGRDIAREQAAERGAKPGRIALADALRRSEEMALEELAAVASRCAGR